VNDYTNQVFIDKANCSFSADRDGTRVVITVDFESFFVVAKTLSLPVKKEVDYIAITLTNGTPIVCDRFNLTDGQKIKLNSLRNVN